MERLTYRLKDQCGNLTDSIILEPYYMRYDEESTKKKILNRLAEYEDTGLTPQEIEQMKSQMLCDKPKCKHNWQYIGLDEYRCTKCGARDYD